MENQNLSDKELENVTGGNSLEETVSEESENIPKCKAEQKEFYVGMNKYEVLPDQGGNH